MKIQIFPAVLLSMCVIACKAGTDGETSGVSASFKPRVYFSKDFKSFLELKEAPQTLTFNKVGFEEGLTFRWKKNTDDSLSLTRVLENSETVSCSGLSASKGGSTVTLTSPGSEDENCLPENAFSYHVGTSVFLFAGDSPSVRIFKDGKHVSENNCLSTLSGTTLKTSCSNNEENTFFELKFVNEIPKDASVKNGTKKTSLTCTRTENNTLITTVCKD